MQYPDLAFDIGSSLNKPSQPGLFLQLTPFVTKFRKAALSCGGIAYRERNQDVKSSSLDFLLNSLSNSMQWKQYLSDIGFATADTERKRR